MAHRPHEVGVHHIDHGKHTDHTRPGADWHGCNGEYGVRRQDVAPRAERSKARVGTWVGDRDRTGALHDPALHTLIGREEERLCGNAGAGCRESQARSWLLDKEECRLMDL